MLFPKIEKESQGLKIRRNSSVLDIKLKVPMGHPFSDDQHAFGHIFGNDQYTCGRRSSVNGEGHPDTVPGSL